MNKTTAWVCTILGVVGFLSGILMFYPIFTSSPPGPEGWCPDLLVEALISVSLIVFSIGASFQKKIKKGSSTNGLDIYKIIIFCCVAYLVFLILGFSVFSCRF